MAKAICMATVHYKDYKKLIEASELASDPLHSGRSHFEHSFSLSFLKTIVSSKTVKSSYGICKRPFLLIISSLEYY